MAIPLLGKPSRKVNYPASYVADYLSSTLWLAARPLLCSTNPTRNDICWPITGFYTTCGDQQWTRALILVLAVLLCTLTSRLLAQRESWMKKTSQLGLPHFMKFHKPSQPVRWLLVSSAHPRTSQIFSRSSRGECSLESCSCCSSQQHSSAWWSWAHPVPGPGNPPLPFAPNNSWPSYKYNLSTSPSPDNKL